MILCLEEMLAYLWLYCGFSRRKPMYEACSTDMQTEIPKNDDSCWVHIE
jgi:hypothetical protein